MEAMDDTTIEIIRKSGNGVLDFSRSLDNGKDVEDTAHSRDSSDCSTAPQESSTEDVPKLPILEKIDDLSDKIQSLRKDHTALTNEVKDITTNSFPGSEVLTALQHLSTEHELLKKKHTEECEYLKDKYLQECTQRKRLYNEVIELKGNIRVFCRCRPLNQDETENGSTSIVEIDPSHDNELQITCVDSSKKQFKFDRVFGPQDGQEAVFAETSPIVTSVLDGFNVCIFAYGQTGTGKTFTMEGTPENRGVNYRTLEELFRIANERSSTMRYELFVSMLEVYNEKIRDLLVENSSQPTKKLEIKQGAEGTQEVPGLVEAQVYGTDEVWELLKTGSQVRSVGSTNANEWSSRSHCLLRVTVKGENLVNGQKTKSNLWLVDLAGSERVGRIEVEGERLKESQFINKSLSALGDVISALASKSAHVPYRNSKLTHMLQSSLGGDCKTVMFVQISPSAADLAETLCSLNFASRVRGIESGPARKQADVSELLKYKQMADKLKHDEKETKKLQDNVQSLQLRLVAREHICRSLQEKVRDLEHQLEEERRLRLRQESKAVSAVSAKPPSSLPTPRHSLSTIPEKKKPPLGLPKPRMPLRRISNMLPLLSPAPSNRTTNFASFFPRSKGDKENDCGIVASSASKSKALMGPRRVSIAVRPSQTSTAQTRQPRRRVSIATLHPEPSSSHINTPLNSQQRPSFLREPTRVVRRCSNLFSRLPESSRTVEATPIGRKISSKFMGSPPSQQIGSWRPKHPTVVALQKKPVVWSPLKLRGLKNHRKSSIFP